MPTDAQIAGGHKANLNNPNTSEESKQHSREVCSYLLTLMGISNLYRSLTLATLSLLARARATRTPITSLAV